MVEKLRQVPQNQGFTGLFLFVCRQGHFPTSPTIASNNSVNTKYENSVSVAIQRALVLE